MDIFFFKKTVDIIACAYANRILSEHCSGGCTITMSENLEPKLLRPCSCCCINEQKPCQRNIETKILCVANNQASETCNCRKCKATCFDIKHKNCMRIWASSLSDSLISQSASYHFFGYWP